MPVRNGAVSVGTAIRSVLQQSWANLELIVVDDGSDDDTASVAITAAAGDQRVQLVRRSARGGAYAARNTGIALATGAYVTFNDGDDWSHPERLTRGIAPLLARPDLMATTSRLIRLGADGQFAAPRVFPFVRANLSSLLFRRQPVLRALGGFDEVPFGGDEEFIARLSTCFGVGSVLRLPTLLAVAMHGGSSLTGSVATGVGSPGGTRLRIAYRELWHRRHVDTFKSWQRGAPDGVRSGNSPGINWHVSKQPIGNAQDTS